MKSTKQMSKESKKKHRKEFNIKEYIRDFLLFVDKKILKTMCILFIISVILIVCSLILVVPAVLQEECQGACRDSIKLFVEYGSTIGELIVTAFAGIVPYMYVPVVGFIGLILGEVSTVAYAIKGYGYILGILASIIPLTLNVVVICIVTSVGIYICKCVTTSNRLFNAKSSSWLDFKINVYEILKKQDKVKSLRKKKEERIKTLEEKSEKINYLQILNTTIVVSIIQFVSILIQHIVF